MIFQRLTRIRKSRKIYLIIFMLLGIFLTGGLLGQYFSNSKSPPSDALSLGGNFTLSSAQGAVSLEQFQGKAVLIYFGYTACPDICPTTLAAIGAAMESLAQNERDATQVLFISVDPERDTPEKSQEYASYFYPSFIGLTGTLEEMALIARQYKAFYGKVEVDSELGYTVGHTGSTYVLGRDGYVRKLVSHDATPDEFASTIKEILKNT
ncbi:MAG TPA: SCO family protein [Gammaproteobacteria bacterium]|nr:SCO family protein [Gammaproteobacteria bacterium]